MKKLTSLTVSLALVAAPFNVNAVPRDVPPKDQELVMALCIIGAVVVAAGVIVYMVRSCQPKYYCVKDQDGNTFPSNATKKERQIEGWTVVSGPYDSAEAAAIACPPKKGANLTSSNGATTIEPASIEDDPGVYIPSEPIQIWRSTNLVNWELRATIMDDPQSFSWSETNSMATSQMFYRIK